VHPYAASAWTFGWTAVAGIATAVLAGLTWWLARSTRDLARETDQDVRSSWRPIVVPSKAEGGASKAQLAKIRVIDRDRTFFLKYEMSLTNVGRGPAINCVLRPQPASAPGSKGITRDGFQVSNLPVGEELPVGLTGDVDNLTGPDFTQELQHVFELEYEDVAGTKHETRLVFATNTDERDSSGQGILFMGRLIETKFKVDRQHHSIRSRLRDAVLPPGRVS
jgi:hypothetical protein